MFALLKNLESKEKYKLVMSDLLGTNIYINLYQFMYFIALKMIKDEFKDNMD